MRPLRTAAPFALTVLVWSAWQAHRHDISSAEERVFRAVNEASDVLAPFVWPVMQLGSLPAVYVAATGRARRAGRDEAVAVAVVGTMVWGGVKLIKPFVGRGRPSDHLARVHVRGHAQTGLGYPSGHAAVSLTLALAATATTAERRLALLGAAVTGVSRMYVGAHLPLDIVGGAAVGWLVGTTATFGAGCRGSR